MASTPSPGWPPSPSSNSSDKCRRYDRQLRLWGDHGQAVIERSSVCLLYATATGCEILKSLILPGLGSFTIVDDRDVERKDIENNFFLPQESLGKNRGASALPYLLEMNSDVFGESVEESPEDILKNNPSFFSAFSIVIASGEIGEKNKNSLSSLLWTLNTPLLFVKTYGFIAYLRLQVKEHVIVESKPENSRHDLSLMSPFPKLIEFFDSQNLESMTKYEHSHTPYVVLLHRALRRWREKMGSPSPKTYQDKLIFKDLLSEDMLKKNGVEESEYEENFEEAFKAVNTALSSPEISPSLKSIFEDSQSSSLTSESSDFWILVRSLRDFAEIKGGRLPLSGTLPDMFSDTERYVALQNIYRAEAERDVDVLYKIVIEHLESLERPSESIGKNDVRVFCKNAHNLRVISSKIPIYKESSYNFGRILDQNPESDILYYLLLLGVDRFYTDYSFYPGSLTDESVETDIGPLKISVNKVLGEYGISHGIKDEYVHEISRYGASELHAMAALIAGIAAHEVIKLLTKQYVPFSNLFIYNALSSESTTFSI